MIGDFVVGVALGEKTEDVELALAELCGERGNMSGRALGNLVEDFFADIGVDIGFAKMGVFDGFNEILSGGAFEEIAIGATADGFENPFVISEGGEDDDFDVGMLFFDFFCGTDAVHDGHFEIHHDEVGGELFGFFDGFETVVGNADDVDVVV